RAGSGSVVYANFEQVTVVNAVATPPVPGAPETFTAVAGLNLVDVVVATFTSGGTGTRAEDFGATINWGDGLPPTAGVIVQDASSPTVFYVQGSHYYTDDGNFTTTTTLRTLGGTSNGFIGSVPVTIAFAASAPVTVDGTANVGGSAPIALSG